MTENDNPDISKPVESLGFASALIKARTDKGMTQAQLSEESGISRSAIKGYETGRNMPGARELRWLCKTLEISPNLLLFGTETPFKRVGPWPHGAKLEPNSFEADKKALALLADLLTPFEVGSLVSLIHSLASARHGAIAIKTDTNEKGEAIVELIRSRK